MKESDVAKPWQHAQGVLAVNQNGTTLYNLLASAFLFGISSHITNEYVQTSHAQCDQPLQKFVLSAGVFGTKSTPKLTTNTTNTINLTSFFLLEGYIMCFGLIVRVLVTFTDSMTTCTMPRHYGSFVCCFFLFCVFVVLNTQI